MRWMVSKSWGAAIAAMMVLGVGLPSAIVADESAEESTEAQEEKPSNTLKWTTATEVDNFGYYVYRATSEDGPFERLNEDPLPGAGTTDEPTSYEFVDDSIEPDTTYWYYLESVSLSGEREKFSPVFKKEPKGTDEDSGQG